MDQQRAARVVDVFARPEVHVLQRLGDVEQSPDVHVEPERAQQPAEDEEVWRGGPSMRAGSA